MGAPANIAWLPPLLMLLIMTLSPLTFAQNNDTTSSSPSTVSTTTTLPSTNSDQVIGGDLNKAARVEEITKDMETGLDGDAVTPKGSDDGGYDVIDVMAATSAGVGKPKNGQTTRIYTTGDVNDDFWLKHLGEDFKHAIHLQVGGTNEDYNRIINQTTNGIHEEVHHEYLPGAERPPELQRQPYQQQAGRAAGYPQPNFVSQLDIDGEALALKNNYLRRQAGQQRLYSRGFGPLSSQYNHRHHTYTQPQPNTHTHMAHQTHQTQHSHTHTHQQPGNQYKPNLGQNPNAGNPAGGQVASSGPGYISSSEDTLHTSQSQAAPTSALSPALNIPRLTEDLDSQLPFKSPFNDYGSRPPRDLTYLLYKRGL